MIDGLRRRILALEERTYADPIVLHFADGSTRVLNGDARRYFALLADGIEGDRGELANAIRDAVHIDESGGSVQLLAVLLQGPSENGQESEL